MLDFLHTFLSDFFLGKFHLVLDTLICALHSIFAIAVSFSLVLVNDIFSLSGVLFPGF